LPALEPLRGPPFPVLQQLIDKILRVHDAPINRMAFGFGAVVLLKLDFTVLVSCGLAFKRFYGLKSLPHFFTVLR
jgi:hypothetical protein